MNAVNPVYILDMKRLWDGQFLGAYKDIPITDLAALFLKKLIKQNSFYVGWIEGC